MAGEITLDNTVVTGYAGVLFYGGELKFPVGAANYDPQLMPDYDLFEQSNYTGSKYTPENKTLNGAILDNIAWHEGDEADTMGMYLDSNGNVTTGLGFMLPNVEAAQKLPYMMSSGKPATPAQIKAEYLRVQAIGKGFVAAKYQGQVYLDISVIRAKFTDKITEDTKYLNLLYPGFDAFPFSVKVGLHDMIYQLGVGGLRSGFPKFNEAVKKQDWATAAQQSHRDLGKDLRNRNLHTYRQILTAK
ncbi:hypothetical protein [Pseudomonas yamanorum]|uniref:hypothetical protein n=1 Tax=Pseudomonas yamanorum TaxID=515393 RepID=UPI002ED4AE6C|nr:hypothetical protein VYI69_13495 [Pseudomonas yamanorum]